jgi:hypothetical protein
LENNRLFYKNKTIQIWENLSGFARWRSPAIVKFRKKTLRLTAMACRLDANNLSVPLKLINYSVGFPGLV